MKEKKKVIVGMSGGVDSSVAALLLLEQGYAVEGLFMKNWEEEAGQESDCAADQDLIDAQAVCLKLGIRLHTVNFATEYWDHVFEYFLAEYRAARTPNPDIICNTEIKFKAFLNHALALGAEQIATGHYARCVKKENEYCLLKGIDRQKDQSYFLHGLNQYQLSHALFPIGDYSKQHIRQLAEQHGFRNHDKKDSTGICFIGERKFTAFLNRYLPAQPGEIVNENGEVLAQHQGLMFYTMGQRQGLGIGGQQAKKELPWYVAGKDIEKNQLIVVQGNDHQMLFKLNLYANNIHWINDITLDFPYCCHAKIRYRQHDQDCQITAIDDQGCASIDFPQAQRAVTPGQSVVFYQGEQCLGGGIIL